MDTPLPSARSRFRAIQVCPRTCQPPRCRLSTMMPDGRRGSPMFGMKRREFFFGVHGQQPAMPAIGFLHLASFETNRENLTAFRRGLQETGYIENKSVAIEYRWSQGRNDRLPALVAELVRRQVFSTGKPKWAFAHERCFERRSALLHHARQARPFQQPNRCAVRDEWRSCRDLRDQRLAGAVCGLRHRGGCCGWAAPVARRSARLYQ